VNPFERAGFELMDERETAGLSRRLLDLYGFDLKMLLDEQHWFLLKRGRSLLAAPLLYLHRFRDLPVQSLGLPLGDEAPDAFVPSHEWVARFAARFTHGRYQLWQTSICRPGCAVKTFGSRLPAVMSPDRCSDRQDSQGRLLGRGRLLSDRIKNLLPRGMAAGGWRLSA
jgi:hypothetical protein